MYKEETHPDGGKRQISKVETEDKGRRYMARRKRFTEEEQKVLAANIYTHKVTAAQIELTAEFKKRFWEERCSGRSIAEAFEACGYDPEILGVNRMKGIAEKLRAQFKAGEEPSTGRRPRGSCKKKLEEDRDGEIDDLRKRVEFLEKQIDFLKRIMPVRTSGKSVSS